MSQKNDTLSPLSCIIVSIFVFASGLNFLFRSELTILKCKRLQLNQKVTCEVTDFSLLGKRSMTIPAGMLQGAKTSKMGKNDYRVVLLTKIGEISMQGYYDGTYKMFVRKRAEQINNFINNPEQMSLEMLLYPNLFTVVMGIAFVVPVLIMALCVLLDFIERKSNIKRIHREISYLDHQDDKSYL